METYSIGLRAEAIILGVISGLLVIGVSHVARRYWTHRTIKSMERRLKYAEARKARLDDLTKSDRSIVLFAFRSLFLLTGVASFTVVASLTVSIFEDGFWAARISAARISTALYWAIFTVIALYFAWLFKQLHEYPGSVRSIDKTIAELKRKLTGSGPPDGGD